MRSELPVSGRPCLHESSLTHQRKALRRPRRGCNGQADRVESRNLGGGLRRRLGGGELAMTATASVASEPVAVERSREILNDLICERRGLQARMADQATLEANRLAIVYWQQHLAQALIDSHRVARDGPDPSNALLQPCRTDR